MVYSNDLYLLMLKTNSNGSEIVTNKSLSNMPFIAIPKVGMWFSTPDYLISLCSDSSPCFLGI